MTHWTDWRRPLGQLMPAELTSWLTDTGSLTQRLQVHNQHDFSVQLLNTQWIKPLPDECLLLDIPLTEQAYLREVRLMDGEQANVYARTVIPLATFQEMEQRFNTLGNSSLGDLLFSDPSMQRGEIEVACLKPGQALYEMAMMEESPRPKELWGRRSLFYLRGKKLLVCEIFLPSLIKG